MSGAMIFWGTLVAAILAIVFAPRRSEMQQQNAREVDAQFDRRVSQAWLVEDHDGSPTDGR